MNSLPIENRHSLTTALDLDEAALRIRDLPDSNKRLPCVNLVKSDDRLERSDNNLSNGDLVANGSAPVVINGNSRMSTGSSHKDVSLGDIESRIPPNSPGHESKRDTIVTVDTDDTTPPGGVRPCCPAFCYCESVCCDNYKESCIRRSWHGLRYYVCAFVEHKYFEWFILFMIVISSLTLVSSKSLFAIDLRVVWIKVHLPRQFPRLLWVSHYCDSSSCISLDISRHFTSSGYEPIGSSQCRAKSKSHLLF